MGVIFVQTTIFVKTATKIQNLIEAHVIISSNLWLSRLRKKIKVGTNGLTEAQRRERQRNLQLHIQLIEHASRCEGCSSSNCAKMKNYLKHGRTCKLKASGGCKICKRIWTLLRIHAQKCKDTVCPIPQCMAIRERIRQLAKQQQAMDDRRRQEMNRAVRMSASSSQGG